MVEADEPSPGDRIEDACRVMHDASGRGMIPHPGHQDPSLPEFDVDSAPQHLDVIDYVLPSEDGGHARRGRLTRHRVGAPAPYVGQRFWYEWWAFLSDDGRAVCGQARAVYPPEWSQPPVER